MREKFLKELREGLYVHRPLPLHPNCEFLLDAAAARDVMDLV